MTNVSPEGDGLGGKITIAELRAQFGESLPIEAAKILQTSPSPDDARAKLAALASPAVPHAAPNTIAAASDGDVYRMFRDDPEAHRSSYLHDHYRRGLQGIMEPDKGAVSAHDAWRAGLDSAAASTIAAGQREAVAPELRAKLADIAKQPDTFGSDTLVCMISLSPSEARAILAIQSPDAVVERCAKIVEGYNSDGFETFDDVKPFIASAIRDGVRS
jgi:hypothetical protein